MIMSIQKKKIKITKTKRFEIITIFPDAFTSYFKESLIRRAQERKLIDIRLHNLRDFTKERHNKVDDKPFGGGPGMVLQVEPLFEAVKKIIAGKPLKTRTILFSTRGQKFDAKVAERLATYDRLIMICGRYEGVDERVAEHIADEEISLGDYVLSGGELPAMIVVEAVSRFLPGFLGKFESLEEVKGSYPVYTRPAEFKPGNGKKAWIVPKVLLAGDHAKIEAWRKPKQSGGR
jgi:tRNA (guanine37-N1)-methyltransferase